MYKISVWIYTKSGILSTIFIKPLWSSSSWTKSWRQGNFKKSDWFFRGLGTGMTEYIHILNHIQSFLAQSQSLFLFLYQDFWWFERGFGELLQKITLLPTLSELGTFRYGFRRCQNYFPIRYIYNLCFYLNSGILIKFSVPLLNSAYHWLN